MTTNISALFGIDKGLATSTGRLKSQTFTSSGVWTRPAGIEIVKIILVGAGGGGGINRGGGGGGEIIWKEVPVNSNMTVIIGAGGIGGSGYPGNQIIATNGGDSSFGAYVAKGGGNGDQTHDMVINNYYGYTVQGFRAGLGGGKNSFSPNNGYPPISSLGSAGGDGGTSRINIPVWSWGSGNFSSGGQNVIGAGKGGIAQYEGQATGSGGYYGSGGGGSWGDGGAGGDLNSNGNNAGNNTGGGGGGPGGNGGSGLCIVYWME